MTRPREELELLLPFHANATLSPAEQAEVDAWLAQDAAAALDARELADIRRDMQADDVRSPGEFGLARLMRDVQRDATQAAGRSGQAASAPPRAGLSQPWLWQAVAALALAALLGQALWPRQSGEPRFELAGAGDGPALVVSFAATATEGQIRALLTDLGLEIVAGPSAVGLYRLRGIDDDTLDTALPVLQGAAEIVETVAHVDD